MDELLSKFGDVWVRDKRSRLWQRGIKLVPWYAKDRLMAIRYRPDGKGKNEYSEGILTVFYAAYGQSLGPYQTRHCRLKTNEYFIILRHKYRS